MRRLRLIAPVPLGVALVVALADSTPGLAQGTRPDSAAADTLRRVVLPELEVRVARAATDARRLPLAVGVLQADAFRRGQLTAGLDEALSRLPGVVVQNRWNWSLDQRLSIRGAGSRANFGLRGVKVLLDGVPQTLPDGQSQLTNVDFGLLERAEVLPGAAAALYGNAAGGVLSFTTERPAAPFAARVRASGGDFGGRKVQGVVSTRGGSASGLLSVSRFSTDGFRQHSAAEATQVYASGELALGSAHLLALRLAAADAPRAENPGALTPAEYAARSDSAAGGNILRGADKDVRQQQLSLQYRWASDGAEISATVFGLLRDLVNPLATPPPAPATPTEGTWNTIDRRVGGFRLAGSAAIAGAATPLRVTGGLDAQVLRDDRRNQRSDQGRPTGVVLSDQRERVSELGPFVQLQWEPADRLLLLGAARYDRLRFRVEDQHFGDGVDNSGSRTMAAWSGSAGASLEVAPAFTLYANLATGFESPTTTELANRPDGQGGFHSDLGPQRTVTVESGARGRLGGAVDASLALYTTRIQDAIVQAREVSGRAYFENAGRVRSRGIEAGLGVAPARWLRLDAAYTFADHRFTEYRLLNGAVVDTLDGKRLAGIPRQFLRAVAAVTAGPVVVELDQLVASRVYADDRNTLEVESWGAGVTGVRVSGDWGAGAVRLRPFASVHNVFGRRYVGSVTINGAFNRVLEPAPGRYAYVGMEVGWAAR